MHNKALRTFGISITAILAVLFIFGLTMSTAQAAVPFTDDFNAGTSNWQGGSGYTLFDAISSGSGDCVVGDCIGHAGSGNYGGSQNNAGSSAFEGTYTYYVKRQTGGSGQTFGMQFCFNSTSLSGVNCSGGTAAFGFINDNQLCAESGTFACWSNDNVYHQYTFSWRNGATYKEFCQLRDDTDLNNCTYSNSGGWNVPNAQSLNGVQIFLSCGSTGACYFDQLEEIGIAPVDTVTVIKQITPTPDSTVATSTNFTFGGKGFVSTDDYTDDTVLYIRYGQQTGMGKRGNGPINQRGEFTIPITTSGDFDLSTTTSIINSGVYIGYIAIQKPRFTLFGFNFFTETLAAATWLFTAGTSTQTELDATVLLLSTTGAGQNLASTTLSTSELGSCQNFLTGSTTECLISLVVPSGEQLTGAAGTLNTALSNNLPFSMFWQPYTLLKSISGSTTPVVGSDINVNMHDTFIQGTTTIFSWTGAKDTVDQAIPNSAVLYLIYAEWIFFGLYCIWRLTKSI